MSSITQTESALSDYVKNFLMQFKDKDGTYRYVDEIDKMMSSNSKFINIDYNDLVTPVSYTHLTLPTIYSV